MLQLLYYLIGITGVTGFAIWIGKFVIKKAFDLGIERYKSSLQKDLESYKNDLSKLSFEHQVRFTRLHEERAEIIRRLYSKIVELENALIHSTTLFQGAEYADDSKRDQNCIKIIRELVSELEYSRIYFGQSTLDKFEIIISESWGITHNMNKARRYASEINKLSQSGRQIPEIYYSEGDLWQQTNERTQKEFKALREDLANEFRTLLGINSSTLQER